MAPGRKRGANKAKAKSQLSIGDLVLAKVKGFPAWPAKISRPEDWERNPDPRKYFVQFFGTEEIAVTRLVLNKVLKDRDLAEISEMVEMTEILARFCTLVLNRRFPVKVVCA